MRSDEFSPSERDKHSRMQRVVLLLLFVCLFFRNMVLSKSLERSETFSFEVRTGDGE